MKGGESITIEKKKEFEDHILRAITNDRWFKGLIVSVKALDQLCDTSHPNNVRFEVCVAINGSVEDLPCRDQ